MKIIGTAVLVLIAGILSSTDSQSTENPVVHSECIRNGGSKTWEDYQISLSNFGNFMSSTMREDFPEGFQYSHGEIDGFSTACGKIEIFNNHIKNFTGSLKSCLEPALHESLDVDLNFSLSSVRFICSNINLIKDVFNNTDEPCINSKMIALSSCRDPLLFDGNTTIANFSGNATYWLERMRYLNFDSNTQTCSLIQNAEQCAVRVLGECENQIFRTALTSFFNYINNDLPCEDLPKSPKSEASQDNSIVNVIS